MKAILQGQKVSGLPEGGTDGQILTKTETGVAWEDAPEDGVISFNGRQGEVTPQNNDYTAEMVGARPSTWTPTATEVGAIANPAGGVAGQILEKTASGTQWADKPSSGILVVNATSSDGENYTATVEGLTELANGILVVFIPSVTSGELVNIFLDINGLGPKEIVYYDPGNREYSKLIGDSRFFSQNTPYLLMYSSEADVWKILSYVGGGLSYMRGQFSKNGVVFAGYQPPAISVIRNITLVTSTPSTISDGEIVGVYST